MFQKKRGKQTALCLPAVSLTHIMPFILNISAHVNKPLIIISFACLHIDLRFPQVNTKAKKETFFSKTTESLLMSHDWKWVIFYFVSDFFWKDRGNQLFPAECFVHLTERLRLLLSQRPWTHSSLDLLTLFLPAVTGSITASHAYVCVCVRACAYFSSVHQVIHHMVHMLLLPRAVEDGLMTHTDYQNMHEEELFFSHATAALDGLLTCCLHLVLSPSLLLFLCPVSSGQPFWPGPF